MKNELTLIKQWTYLERGFRRSMAKHDFMQIYAPLITEIQLEPYSGRAFTLPYYGKRAYLLQSPQLYKQLALQKGIKRVFVVTENLRKIPKDSKGWLAEFTTWDFEMSGISALDALLAQVQKTLREMFTVLKQKKLVSPKLPRKIPIFTIDEVQELLQKKDGSLKLSERDQKKLHSIVMKKYKSDIYIVTHFSENDRAFYFKRSRGRSMCFDIFYKGLEIGNGGIRETSYKKLISQTKSKGLSIKELSPYLKIFKNKTSKQGGVSFSPARIIQAINDAKSLEDVMLFARTPKKLNP